MRIIPDTDNARAWRLLLFGCTTVTAIIYLYNALLIPGSFDFAPFTIQDDARQFLSWMSRLSDPHAMEGDRELCLEHGMDAYVPKPVAVGALREALARVAVRQLTPQ